MYQNAQIQRENTHTHTHKSVSGRKRTEKRIYEWLEVSNLELNLPHRDVMTIESIIGKKYTKWKG